MKEDEITEPVPLFRAFHPLSLKKQQGEGIGAKKGRCCVSGLSQTQGEAEETQLSIAACAETSSASGVVCLLQKPNGLYEAPV